MNKKELTEADIRTKFITPALVPPGGSWDLMTQLREEVHFTKGRVVVRGKTIKRGEAKKADYLLYYKPGIPIAVIEAKDNNESVGAGMQQALEYAEILDVPFAYSSNGDAFLEHDRTGAAGTVEREIPLDQFPSPASLRDRNRTAKGYTPEQEVVTTQDYYDDGSGKAPRYYHYCHQSHRRSHRPRGESYSPGHGHRHREDLHGLSDHLAALEVGCQEAYPVPRRPQHSRRSNQDQRLQTVRPGDDEITNRTADKAFEIYLSLYQAVTGTEEEQNIYKQFSPDFFDLVVVDECHRGSAADDAAWHKVLEYFSRRRRSA